MDTVDSIDTREPWPVAMIRLMRVRHWLKNIFVLNDVRDRAADAAHPGKRLRPVASAGCRPARRVGLVSGLTVVA
jgi:4-hydroxybenzoate polyprenyltransferase